MNKVGLRFQDINFKPRKLKVNWTKMSDHLDYLETFIFKDEFNFEVVHKDKNGQLLLPLEYKDE